jgi:ParB family chromosome partitioning protein
LLPTTRTTSRPQKRFCFPPSTDYQTDKLIGFALRLVFTGHTAIPRENEIDFLTEAEAAFTPPQPKKTASKKTKTPTPFETAQKTAVKKKTAKKQLAA